MQCAAIGNMLDASTFFPAYCVGLLCAQNSCARVLLNTCTGNRDRLHTIEALMSYIAFIAENP
jgi:hypothetical protein